MATSGIGIADPTTLAGKNVDKGLLRRAWSNDIKYESLQHDPLFNLPALTAQINPGEVGGKNKIATVPNKCFMDITPKGNEKYARSVTLQLTKALQGDAREGRDTNTILGNEENVRMKYFNALANDWAHAVTKQNYGIDAREMEPTQAYKVVKPLLSQWYGEYNGYSARHAVTQSVSPNLLKAPTVDELDIGTGTGGATGSVAPINQNSYIMGLPNSSQIVFDNTYADQEAYEDALLAAIDGVAAADAHLTVRSVLDMIDYIGDSYVKPIQWQGYELYILYADQIEFTNLIDPAKAGSFSKYWVDAASLGSGDLHKVIPAANMVIGDSIVIAKDKRCPQLSFDTGASDTFAFSYMKPGRNDQRKVALGSYDTHIACNMLLGESALVKFEPEPATYKGQMDVYDKFEGVGYFGACSWMTPRWGLNPTNNGTDIGNVQQEGSFVVYTNKVFA